MRNLMPITRPMGAADLTIAAEDAGSMDHAQIYAAPEAQQDAELLDALYPQPVPQPEPQAGTVEDAVVAGAAAVADLVSEPAPRVAVAVQPVVEAKRAATASPASRSATRCNGCWPRRTPRSEIDQRSSPPPETRRGADLAPHSIIPRRVQARPAGPRRQAPIADHPRVAWAA